ncbi:MAG: hypothetical protein CMM50_10465 [Rhodospirillaceae bacterium]|nr:hypothetical protein [Rhodospirillaceae bacterium]
MSEELNRLSAGDAAARIAAGQATSAALVSDCFDRIAEREERIGAWQYLDRDAALAEARARDAAAARGPLHGIPVAVKDLIDTADMPTTYGSPIYADHRPAKDAACVSAVRAAGGVVLGKTVTTEFATFKPGKTANPRNPQHTPGGSSSGSAAAVADWMAPLAFGTQTAGSVIRPAAFCGIVGYKASHGLHDIRGIKLLSETLDTLGFFARSVEDVSLFASAIGGRPRPDLALDRPPRIGLCRTPQWAAALQPTRLLIEGVAKQLAAAGAEMLQGELPLDFSPLVEAQVDIMGYEAARNLATERRKHSDLLSPALQKLLETGAACPKARYRDARFIAQHCRDMLDDVMGKCDVLLAPAAPAEAPKGLEATGDPVFNRMWTLLHTPCLTLPAGTGPMGLPLGVQLIARIGDDERLLRVANWVETRLAGSR